MKRTDYEALHYAVLSSLLLLPLFLVLNILLISLPRRGESINQNKETNLTKQKDM
jgi:hypothetical protein